VTATAVHCISVFASCSTTVIMLKLEQMQKLQICYSLQITTQTILNIKAKVKVTTGFTKS